MFEGIARRFSENSNDPDFLPFLLADPLQPKRLPTAWVGALSRWINGSSTRKKAPRRPLIIQGQADMTVDWQHNLQVLKCKFDRPQILLLPQARHHLANETADMREEYFEFLTKRIRGRESSSVSKGLFASRPAPTGDRDHSGRGLAREGGLSGDAVYWPRFEVFCPTASPARIAASAA